MKIQSFMYIFCYMKRIIICLLFIAAPTFAQMPKDVGDLCNDETWEAYKYVNAPHLVSDSPSGQFQYRDVYCKNTGKTAWLKKSLPDDPPLGKIKGAFLAKKGQTVDIGLGIAAARDSWWYIIEDKSVSPEPWLMSVDKVQAKN